MKNELGDYPQKSNEQYTKEGKQIFHQLCKTNYSRFEERQNIISGNNNFYFTSTQIGGFFIACVDSGYSERFVYQLFEDIQKEGLYDMIEGDSLSLEGKKKLKSLYEKYEDLKNLNSIIAANLEIETVKKNMGNSIKGMMNNIDQLNELDGKARTIKEGSLLYQKDAKDLERITWWQNCKYTIIIIVIVIGLFLVVGLPIILSLGGGSSGSSSNNQNSNNNNNNINNNNNTNSTNGSLLFLN